MKQRRTTGIRKDEQFQLNKYHTHRDTFLYSPYLLLRRSNPASYTYTCIHSLNSYSSSALSFSSSYCRLLLSELVLYKRDEKGTRTPLTNAFLRHLPSFSIRPVVELPRNMVCLCLPCFLQSTKLMKRLCCSKYIQCGLISAGELERSGIHR